MGMTRNNSERTAPELPIFIVEGHDVGIYESLEVAESDLEPIDVKAGVYAGYDAGGRRLKIETDGKLTFITLAELEQSGAIELEEVLREYLDAMGESSARDPACDLPGLVQDGREHSDNTRPQFRLFNGFRRRR
jgi:hypothetical protein